MNETLQEGVQLAKDINDLLKADKPNCDVVICTPFIHGDECEEPAHEAGNYLICRLKGP